MDGSIGEERPKKQLASKFLEMTIAKIMPYFKKFRPFLIYFPYSKACPMCNALGSKWLFRVGRHTNKSTSLQLFKSARDGSQVIPRKKADSIYCSGKAPFTHLHKLVIESYCATSTEFLQLAKNNPTKYNHIIWEIISLFCGIIASGK